MQRKPWVNCVMGQTEVEEGSSAVQVCHPANMKDKRLLFPPFYNMVIKMKSHSIWIIKTF